MTDQTTIFDRLRAPFPADRVSWRVGNTNQDKTRGMAFAYIDARDVMDRLDEVCGPENWQCRYPHANGKTVCELAVRVGDEWVWKSDGAGDTDFEAEKGALSDAFKRAAVRWGIGRYLYDVDAPWVDIEARGKSVAIKPEGLTKLRQLLGGNPPPRGLNGAATKPEGLNGAVAKLASELIAEIKQARTPRELATWVTSPEAERRFKALDDANSARVRSAYTARMRELKEAGAFSA